MTRGTKLPKPPYYISYREMPHLPGINCIPLSKGKYCLVRVEFKTFLYCLILILGMWFFECKFLQFFLKNAPIILFWLTFFHIKEKPYKLLTNLTNDVLLIERNVWNMGIISFHIIITYIIIQQIVRSFIETGRIHGISIDRLIEFWVNNKLYFHF